MSGAFTSVSARCEHRSEPSLVGSPERDNSKPSRRGDRIRERCAPSTRAHLSSTFARRRFSPPRRGFASAPDRKATCSPYPLLFESLRFIVDRRKNVPAIDERPGEVPRREYIRRERFSSGVNRWRDSNATHTPAQQTLRDRRAPGVPARLPVDDPVAPPLARLRRLPGGADYSGLGGLRRD